jgi:hypothetical protein
MGMWGADFEWATTDVNDQAARGRGIFLSLESVGTRYSKIQAP